MASPPKPFITCSNPTFNLACYKRLRLLHLDPTKVAIHTGPSGGSLCNCELCIVLSLHVQVAVTQHALAQERTDQERRAAAIETPDRGGVPQGSLPNLFLGSHGEESLRNSPRYVCLPAYDSAACPTPTAQDLPSIPQRTAAWHKARQHAVTASNAALLLGMLEPKTSKELAASKLRLYASEGHSRLCQALSDMRSAEPASNVSGRGPFAACAMEMGTIKEPDVMLTYLQHMDDRKEYAPIALALPMNCMIWPES